MAASPSNLNPRNWNPQEIAKSLTIYVRAAITTIFWLVVAAFCAAAGCAALVTIWKVLTGILKALGVWE